MNLTVCLAVNQPFNQVINQATRLIINHHYFISESTIQTVRVLFKSKLTVRCES